MWNNRKFFKRNTIENKQYILLLNSCPAAAVIRFSIMLSTLFAKSYFETVPTFFLSTYARSPSHLICASLQDLMSQLLSVVASTGALDDGDALVCKQRQFSCCTFHN